MSFILSMVFTALGIVFVCKNEVPFGLSFLLVGGVHTICVSLSVISSRLKSINETINKIQVKEMEDFLK